MGNKPGLPLKDETNMWINKKIKNLVDKKFNFNIITYIVLEPVL